MAEEQATVRSTASVNKNVRSVASVNKSDVTGFDPIRARVKKTNWTDVLCSAAPFLSAVVSGWYLHPLTVMAYRRAINSREARLDQDQWETFQALRLQDHPGRWTFTIGPVGAIEFSVFLLAQELCKPLLESMMGTRLFSRPKADLVQNADILDPERFFTSWAEEPEIVWRVVTSVFAAIVARPFTLLRNRLNSQQILPTGKFKYEGHIDAFNKIIDEEGIAPFARGLFPTILMLTACDFIQGYYRSRRNWLMATLTRAFPTNNPNILAIQHALCSGVNAYASAAVPMILLRPFEVVLRRLDMQRSGLEELLTMPKYDNWISCFTSILNEEGIQGFFNGLDLELMRDFIPLFGVACISDLLHSYMGENIPQYKTYSDW